MADGLNYQALALAGVAQAAAAVHAAARGRALPEAAEAALLASVPTHRAEDLAEVFPDPTAFGPGIVAASEALSGKAPAPEVVRYALQLIELARMLNGVPQVADKLGRLLDGVDAGNPDPAQLGSIYQQTISTLGKRIHVTGDPEVLRREDAAERIRALLLAGVRLAWLWRQLGGRRWHLVLRRRALLVGLRALAQSTSGAE